MLKHLGKSDFMFYCKNLILATGLYEGKECRVNIGLLLADILYFIMFWWKSDLMCFSISFSSICVDDSSFSPNASCYMNAIFTLALHDFFFYSGEWVTEIGVCGWCLCDRSFCSRLRLNIKAFGGKQGCAKTHVLLPISIIKSIRY